MPNLTKQAIRTIMMIHTRSPFWCLTQAPIHILISRGLLKTLQTKKRIQMRIRTSFCPNIVKRRDSRQERIQRSFTRRAPLSKNSRRWPGKETCKRQWCTDRIRHSNKLGMARISGAQQIATLNTTWLGWINYERHSFKSSTRLTRLSRPSRVALSG